MKVGILTYHYALNYGAVLQCFALKKVLDVPVIFNADIGHVAPKMTIINGSIATISSSNGKGTITQELI